MEFGNAEVHCGPTTRPGTAKRVGTTTESHPAIVVHRWKLHTSLDTLCDTLAPPLLRGVNRIEDADSRVMMRVIGSGDLVEMESGVRTGTNNI